MNLTKEELMLILEVMGKLSVTKDRKFISILSSIMLKLLDELERTEKETTNARL